VLGGGTGSKVVVRALRAEREGDEQQDEEALHGRRFSHVAAHRPEATARWVRTSIRRHNLVTAALPGIIVPMPPHNVAALVHLVGFLTGAELFAMLFGLVLRRRVDDRLPLLTAVLGLIWYVY